MSSGRQLISAALRDLVVHQSQRDPRQWAHDLKAREESGERLSEVQRAMWRSALRIDLNADERTAA